MRREITVVFLMLACAWLMTGCEDDTSAETEETSLGSATEASEEEGGESTEEEGGESTEEEGGESTEEEGGESTEEEGGESTEEEGGESTEEEGGESPEEEGGEATEEEGGESTEEEGGESTEEEGGESTEEEGGESTEEEGGESTEEEGGESTEEEGGESTEEEGGEEELACFPPDTGFACNPLDSSSCDESMDESCDATYAEDGTLDGFACNKGFEKGKPLSFCNNETGNYCDIGLTCFNYVCAIVCCSSEECMPGEECMTPPSWSALSDSGIGVCQWAEPAGTTNKSCGDPANGEGNVTVDCTINGDMDSFCVFGDHCLCSEGYICEGSDADGSSGIPECVNGVTCVADPNWKPGQSAKYCGDPQQGPDIETVDCTAYGDFLADCVFSNHCMCSEGFVCEEPYPGSPAGSSECANGSSCIPEIQGYYPTSCGDPGQGPEIETVDCTVNGDTEAMCVFSNHCMCSDGFICEEPYPGLTLEDKECVNGSTCIVDPTWMAGAEPTSCGNEVSGLGPVDCTVNGDMGAFCVYGDHCACSEGFKCEGGEPNTGEIDYTECEPGVVCVLAD